jgi:hypothetical protein
MENTVRYRACECCGKMTEEKDLNICSSGLGACSFAYCNECLVGGYEPYGAIIGLLSCIGIEGYLGDNEDRKAWLLKNLELHGKTMEELKADVKKQDDAFYEWCRQMEETEEQYERELLKVEKEMADSEAALKAPKIARPVENKVVTKPEEF